MSRENFKPGLRRALPAAREAKGITKAAPVGVRPLTPPPVLNGQDDPLGAQPPASEDAALPPLLRASQIVPSKIILPPVLIDGLLHRGCKMVLAGGSKSYKSWTLIDLGLAVATGTEWMGLKCQQGVVLFLNFELIQGFFEWRIHHVSKARKLPMPDWFLYWNLRHKCYDLRTVARVLKLRIAEMGWRVDLLIIDPIYKALGGLDENSASDMSALMLAIEEISEQTGAAVVFGAHFSKGGQAGKEAKDRISGSGVFGRDPDAILTMTKHTQPQCYTIESDLRYVSPLPEFVVQWDFPVMNVNEGLDPQDLYQAPTAASLKKALPKDGTEPLTPEAVLAVLTHSGMQDALWRDRVTEKLGRSGPDYYTCKKALIDSGRVTKIGLKYVPCQFALSDATEEP